MRLPEKKPAGKFCCHEVVHAGLPIEVSTSYGNLAAYAPSQTTLRQNKRRLDGTLSDVNGNQVAAGQPRKESGVVIVSTNPDQDASGR